MTSANERLYNGYLRRNMATIVSRVKPIEMMLHLACLTDHDREEIKVKTETRGKFDGMLCLLDCLKRREQWLEQLIKALEACEHITIAAEIREEYNALMGFGNSSTSLPPTTVVRENVHPALSARPLELPMHPDVSRPGEALEGGAAAAESPEDEEPEAECLAAKSSEAVQARMSISPPLPLLQPPRPAPTEMQLSPSTPPPESPQRQEITDPPLQIVAISHLHWKGNSELNSDQTLCVNSEKLPVQDTNPPFAKVTTEVVETRPTSFLESDETGLCRHPQDDRSVCLSKPYQLISIRSSNEFCPTLLAASVFNQPSSQFHLTQPYSGLSDRLEISHSTPAGSYSISDCNSEEEENHYNSSTSSFSIQLEYENVVQMLEEPSVLNLKGQMSTSHTEINGEVANEAVLTPNLSSADTQSHLSLESSDTAKAAGAEKLGSPAPPTWFTKNVLTVAGVGVCALLVVWKFKN